jgi:hypothetical protein
MGNNHEIEFHEIEIAIFHEIKIIAKFHEIKIGILQEIKTFCKIDQEIDKALETLGGHYFRLFSLT